MVVIVFLVVAFLTTKVSTDSSFNNIKDRYFIPVPRTLPKNVGEGVERGSNLALEFCQKLFTWDKWNCSTSSFFRLSKQEPTRESAFSKAILAAGIVHAVTKSCSRGEIANCGCHSNLKSLPTVFDYSSTLNESYGIEKKFIDWSWSGCSDDPTYAEEVAKNVLNALQNSNDVVDYVARHNINVGREIIRNTMVKKCRCHGPSHMCSMQTCRMELAPFREVAILLKKKYRKTERLAVEAVEASIVMSNRVRELTGKKEISAKKDTLVYLTQSPDYCVANPQLNILGTKGRICSGNNTRFASYEERRSCRTLCKDCGYQKKKIVTVTETRCKCKFEWCCEVTCEICITPVVKYICD